MSVAAKLQCLAASLTILRCVSAHAEALQACVQDDSCASNGYEALDAWRSMVVKDATQEITEGVVALVQRRIKKHKKTKHQGRQCGIVWYYHIPKCGDKSVEQWLRHMEDKGMIDDVLPLRTMGPGGELMEFQTTDGQINFTSYSDNLLDPFVENPDHRLIAILHQDRAPGLYEMKPYLKDLKHKLQQKGCDLFRVTYLREPVDLATSALLFFDRAEQNDPEHVAPAEIRNITDQTDRLRVALATDKYYDNMMIRYILNNKREDDGPLPRNGGAEYPMELGAVDEKAVREALNILKSFEVVGFTNDMTGGLHQLEKMLGLQMTGKMPHQSDMYALQVEGIPFDILDTIQKRTAKDKILYEAAQYLK